MPASRRESPQNTRASDLRIVQSVLYAHSSVRARMVGVVEISSRTKPPFAAVEQVLCARRDGKVHDCAVSISDVAGREHNFQLFFFKGERNHTSTSVPLQSHPWRGEIIVMKMGCRRGGYVHIRSSDFTKVETIIDRFTSIFSGYKAADIPANISIML
ncbi:hypothetical protein BOTBODRAFT_187004 [Botryobasidium botryosum FD-172 SS1]|uniref:Uncharacterized protein n=1 Tax=Botryobasidium botryosum (strain FD-172 SS1) TaxID=930990 RepID=A0A067MVS0_BOTB1|nr:hypothetical protein BOTBODRAFT_187004 [Botryobasidium botryosum FD-172 SS1]